MRTQKSRPRCCPKRHLPLWTVKLICGFNGFLYIEAEEIRYQSPSNVENVIRKSHIKLEQRTPELHPSPTPSESHRKRCFSGVGENEKELSPDKL
jgi:hypothetical protein